MKHHVGFDYRTSKVFPNKLNQLSMCDLHASDTGPLWKRRETFTAILVQQKRKTPIMKLLYALDVSLLASYYIRVSHIPDMLESLGTLLLPLSTMSFFIQNSVNQAFPIRPHLDGWRKLVYGGNCFILAAYVLNYRFVPMGQKFVDVASCLVIQVAYRVVYFRSHTLEGEAYLLLQAWLIIIALLHLIFLETLPF
ncbi:hypothetical protein IQ07DRAFT_364334 [Pyrenochaeta sp. DS3sAY3a]|nr:hypothetical protein IQ07DRAFT_364334 [Pyrenochaeta sp. DS3sAY3a]